MLRVPCETTNMKSRLPAEKSTRLENWTRLLSSVVPAPREYHKQKGIHLKKPHKVQAQEKGKTFGLLLPVNVDEGKKMPHCLINHCN